MSFQPLPLNRANRLINHGPVILVSARFGGKANAMTAAWAMPVSHSPPMVAVAIGPGRFTHDLILESGEFAVNVPGVDLLETVWCCGKNSGRTRDKFDHCGMTAVDGKHVQAPLIGECLGALECRLVAHPVAGDHTVMIGEVLAVWARQGVFDQRLLVEKPEARTLHHLGGPDFCAPGSVIRAGG